MTTDGAARRVGDRPERRFLLSPASLTGVRGRRIVAGRGATPLLDALRRGAAVPLGDVYAAISPLYFGGKRDYARRFTHEPSQVLVITPSRGLLPVDAPIDLAGLEAFADSTIDVTEPSYTGPLLGTSRTLLGRLPDDAGIVLLGSVATSKYLAPLGEVFGERLFVPRSFFGRGSLSRGSMLRRAVASGQELEYVSASESA